jgi:hypothetical protein
MQVTRDIALRNGTTIVQHVRKLVLEKKLAKVTGERVASHLIELY